MKKNQRLIIFETVVGSKLYGTSRPESDDDFMGVFIPSFEDMFSLEACPTEWSMDKKISTGQRNSVGDIDRKFYSLQTFLKLAGQGQPKQIEMLFSPQSSWTVSHSIWHTILKNKDLFLSENAVEPFIGFAEAQMKKSILKGDNLTQIRELISFLSNQRQHSHIGTVLPEFLKFKELDQEVLPDGTEAFSIAGRRFGKNQQVKIMMSTLKTMEKKYGKRSEMAAQAGVDYKALTHAYRLIFQAEMIKTTGALEFPLPKKYVDFLMPIRLGKVPENFTEDLAERIEKLKLLPSVLPKDVDWLKINSLCQNILMEHFCDKSI